MDSNWALLPPAQDECSEWLVNEDVNLLTFPKASSLYVAAVRSQNVLNEPVILPSSLLMVSEGSSSFEPADGPY